MAHTPLNGSVPEAELYAATTLVLAIRLAIARKNGTDDQLCNKLQLQLHTKLGANMVRTRLPIKATLKRTLVTQQGAPTAKAYTNQLQKKNALQKKKRSSRRITSITCKIKLHKTACDKKQNTGRCRRTGLTSYNDYYFKGNKRAMSSQLSRA